jgi:hypothetical protein
MPFMNTLAKQLMGYEVVHSLDWMSEGQVFRSHLEGGVKRPGWRLAP